MWRRVRPYVAALLEECPVSLERTVVLSSPHISWDKSTNGQQFFRSWAAAASVIPYRHEVGQIVADTLLHIGSRDSLRPHIPVGTWSWLYRQPSFPFEFWGRLRGSQRDVIQTARTPENPKVIKSCMLLVRSEWDYLVFLGLHEMCTSIQEDFCGIEMGCDREDLLRRLDQVLS